MRYISTRGQSAPQAFCDILLGGLAPDGGLYLPESYPQITRSELDAWRKLSYADLAYEILSKFITDIPAGDLKALVAKTYTAEVYCHTRNGGNAAHNDLDNISVAVTDGFMDALRSDGEYELVAPHTGNLTARLRARVSPPGRGAGFSPRGRPT